MTSGYSLQEKETAALQGILRAGSPEGTLEWKVLVYDPVGRDIIAPLLKVGSLRKLGITIHMMLATEREPIRDAPAVYFVQPTPENVALLCKDCKADLYQSFNINFISPISRTLLETMAQELASLPTINHVQIFDQFLNFVALEPDLFSLMLDGSYRTLHSPQALITDQQMDAYIDEIVGGLTSVVLQLQVLPVVVSVKGGAAQAVAEKVTCRLADLLRERHLEPVSTATRPVLLLCDRNNDIPVCLVHPWSYRCMLADVLGMRLNKVQLKDEENPTKKKVYELDSRDQFWQNNAGALYHDFSDRAYEELSKFKESKDKVTQEQGDDLDGMTESVTSLMSSVPQMKEQKKFVDMHTNLGYALLNEIKARHLDAFHQIEMALINKEAWDPAKFQELLAESSGGTAVDRLRLFLVYYLTAEPEKDDRAEKELARWERTLADAGVDLAALSFLKNIRAFSRSRLEKTDSSLSKTLLGFGAGLSEQLKKAKLQLESTLKQRNLFLLPLTRMVDSILQDVPSRGSSSSRERITDNLYCHDPKTGSRIDVTQFRFTHAIVFIVGGGNYLEYQNLKDWEKQLQQNRKHVIYGGTEMLNAEGFLQQLAFLGQNP
eukprot:RCo018673